MEKRRKRNNDNKEKNKELQRLSNKLESATDKAKKEYLDVTRTWDLKEQGVMIYCK
jgi:hypothetical protein